MVHWHLGTEKDCKKIKLSLLNESYSLTMLKKTVRITLDVEQFHANP